MDSNMEYQVHDRILGLQSFILFQLMNPLTVNRIYDNQLKVPAQADSFDVPELFRTLNSVVWAELNDTAWGNWTNRKPRISSIRRGLQRSHLERLIGIVLSRPGRRYNADCHSVARMALKDLGERIEQALTATGARLDDYSLAHLTETKTRIARALEAEFTAPG